MSSGTLCPPTGTRLHPTGTGIKTFGEQGMHLKSMTKMTRQNHGFDEDGEFDDAGEGDRDKNNSRMEEDGEGDDIDHGGCHLNNTEEDATNKEHGL
ncbi:hypothetical protein KEM48_001439 [Puccinia striiformis f. sp. tritici PST-130]|nr:hypothetical protein H4Q26_001174 [Puccinia striiformis f. sp. tritici PST-130]KAI9603484.1 hypothetical protein KEM48_001439 [Puccinia striiformis f. sp. tritici PST-130]